MDAVGRPLSFDILRSPVASNSVCPRNALCTWMAHLIFDDLPRATASPIFKQWKRSGTPEHFSRVHESHRSEHRFPDSLLCALTECAPSFRRFLSSVLVQEGHWSRIGRHGVRCSSSLHFQEKLLDWRFSSFSREDRRAEIYSRLPRRFPRVSNRSKKCFPTVHQVRQARYSEQNKFSA